MSTTTEVVKGELYPTQDVNPLEATFCLLKSMRHEIEELREMLDEERRARGGETANLAAQVQELRGAKQQRFKEVDDTIEDIKTDTLTRFQKLQERMDQTASVKEERFEILEAKMESESSDRTAMCQAVSKRLTHEASQLRERAETVDKEVQDQKRQFKIHGADDWQRHEDLRMEVDRLSAILRDNSLAKDPFRHFPAKQMLPALSTSTRSSEPEHKMSSSRSWATTPDLKMPLPRPSTATPDLKTSVPQAVSPIHSELRLHPCPIELAFATPSASRLTRGT